MATTFAVPDGRVAMAATTYTGTGATLAVSNAVNTVSFQPDLLWIKNRSAVNSNQLADSIRGVTKYLFSDTTGAEETRTDQVTALSASGFSLSALVVNTAVNNTGNNYVGWQWKAGGTAVSNTAGTITSSVSANTTAGFSVVTYTGNGVNSTMGHGLGVAPAMIFYKSRTTAEGWPVYHSALAVTNSLALNNSNLQQPGGSYYWNDTAPTSTLIRAGTDTANNGNGTNYVAYCWAPVAGYSAFGSYTGNGSADGPFIYTGFRPRWIMFKRTDSTSNWVIVDTTRNTFNVMNSTLWADLSTAESTAYSWGDSLSNGFKFRDAANGLNASGGTYIYAAFAENPLKFSNAR